MTQDVEGCPTCWGSRPPAVTVEHPGGARTISETCADCGQVWGFKLLTLQEVIVLDTTAAIYDMLTALAEAITASQGRAPQDQVLDEIEQRYGPEARAAIVDFMVTVIEVEQESHTIAAARNLNQ